MKISFYVNQRRTQVKLLVWEGDRFAIYHKRLSRGTFGTPVYDPATRSMVVEKKDLMLILEGIEVRYRKRYSRPVRKESVRSENILNKFSI